MDTAFIIALIALPLIGVATIFALYRPQKQKERRRYRRGNSSDSGGDVATGHPIYWMPTDSTTYHHNNSDADCSGGRNENYDGGSTPSYDSGSYSSDGGGGGD